MTSRGVRRQLPLTRLTEDTGSLAVAMLLSLVAVMLSALMVPTVLVQFRATSEAVGRVHALHAAQAGLDVALGHIRAANDGDGGGVIADLPCGPFTGPAGAGATARYEVRIDYFDVDPQNRPDSWIDANRISCLDGGGASSMPSYALLRALGTDSPTGDFDSVATRFLHATYVFRTTNANIPGGLIHVVKTDTSPDLCMDAGSGSPDAGTNLQMQPCDPGSAQQTFAYTPNLNLLLLSSRTPSMPLGMCLDAATPHAHRNIVQFQPCSAATQARQQWSHNGGSNFEGTTDGSNLDSNCFNVQTPDTAGSFLVLGECNWWYSTTWSWSPDAAVGAGSAGPATGQLVNFDQFGRCVDLTSSDVTSEYLIVWPCHQAPDPTTISRNQVWDSPPIADDSSSGTGPISTIGSYGHYCLRSPGTTAPGQYVTVVPCPTGATPQDLTWTVYEDTGAYATSYRIVDGWGNCLSPTETDATSTDLFMYGHEVSKVVVAECSGATLQKWNAPPNVLRPAPLKGFGER